MRGPRVRWGRLRGALVWLWLVLVPGLAFAQTADDRGFLQGLLEDALSSEGITVRLEGFRGALSSRATVDRISISDPQGVWLSAEDVALTWTRSALLEGRVEIDEIRIARLSLPRQPILPASAPSPEARSAFALPDLPVSIALADLTVLSAEIGAPLLGEAVTLAVAGSARLAAGAGEADLTVTRQDRGGEIAFAGRYDNATRDLALDLSVAEPAGGLAAGMLGVPGTPSVALTLAGDAPIDDFEARLQLSTDGQTRLAGSVILWADGDTGTRRFRLDVGGDIAPVVAPQYRDFLGRDVALQAEVQQAADGRLTLSDLQMRAQALRLTGFAQLAADGWPEALDLQGVIVPPSGGRVRLPLPGAELTVARVDLSGRFDATEGDSWQLTARAQDVVQSGLGEVARLAFTGSGEIGRTANRVRGLTRVAVEGLTLEDATLGAVVGPALRGQLGFDWQPGAPLVLRDLDLAGADYGLRGGLEVADAQSLNPVITPDLELRAEDLARFAPLVGVDLTGRATLGVTGQVAPVTGALDLRLAGQTGGLGTGIAQVDPLLAGAGRVSFRAVRDSAGLRVSPLEIATEAARITGTADLVTGASQAALQFQIAETDVVLPGVSGASDLALTAQQDGAVWQVALTGALPQTAQLRYTGTVAPEGLRLTGRLEAQVDRLSAFADLAGQPLSGALALVLEGAGSLTEQSFALQAQARGRDLRPGLAALDPVLAGESTIRLRAEAQDGRVTLSDLVVSGPLDLTLDGTLSGQIPEAAGPEQAQGQGVDLAALDLRAAGRLIADLPRLSRFSRLAGRALAGALALDLRLDGPLTQGALTVSGRAETRDVSLSLPQIDPLLAGRTVLEGRGRRLDSGLVEISGLTLAGAVQASLSGTVLAEAGDRLDVDGQIEATVPRLSVLSALAGQRLSGRAQITGRVTGEAVSGPLAVDAQVVTSGLGIGNEMVDPFLRGGLRADVALAQLSGGAVRIDRMDLTGAALNGGLSGSWSTAQSALSLRLSVDGVERVLPDVQGQVQVSGTARHSGGPWQLDLQGSGPRGIGLQANGAMAQDAGSADMTLRGQVPLALLNARIKPQVASGVARFDLALRGAPALSSLSGQVAMDGARVAAPDVNLALENITGGLSLGGGAAQLGLQGQLSSGGRILLTGPVQLQPPYRAALNAALKGARLRQADLFETTAEGNIQVEGPLLGGARIGGRVVLGQVELRVPNIGPSYAALDGLRHLNPPADVARTLLFAGLSQSPETAREAALPAFPLDLAVDAPNRIFVRGRGLDAELGGSLRLTGTSADILPVGQFDLIRGRLDLLGKRLELTEGAVSLQGSFDPFVSFAATSTVEDTEITIRLAGPASAPELTVSSAPELPQDEALAFFLFGQSVTELSPLQAVQLAAAIQSLTGQGGLGLTEGIRSGLGVDDLDIGTDADGGVEARVGKYISDNIYTDVTVGSGGKSEINLNLTVNPNVTVRGRVSSDGTSGLGVFFERDY